MLRKMVSYLMEHREVVLLVKSGQAALVGVTPMQQKALIEVIGEREGAKVEPMKGYWNYP
jgi:hypothetical protein